MKAILKYLNLALGSVLVLVMLVILWGGDPASMSAPELLEQSQKMIRLLNTPMPVLGLFTIVLALAGAVMRRTDPVARVLLVVATLLFAASGLVTRFGNQPINAQVMTWTADTLPTIWRSLRDAWWHWHILRTILSVLALALLFVGYGRKTKVQTV